MVLSIGRRQLNEFNENGTMPVFRRLVLNLDYVLYRERSNNNIKNKKKKQIKPNI